MTKRLIAILAALAIAAMTAGGGVAYAQHSARHHATHHVKAASEPGEETTPGEEPSDGPGGHEDEPGGEVDHQFEGVE
jgi:hypothetical protein